VWSDEISTGGVSEPHTKGSGDAELPLIPIVVGVAVLALVVIVVTVVLIKRKKSRNLDPEKAENGKTNHHHNNLANSDEETQKLNDPHA
jgi:flagellar basal body-associated protein FliL